MLMSYIHLSLLYLKGSETIRTEQREKLPLNMVAAGPVAQGGLKLGDSSELN